jgi:acetoin utilization deacetylase AcuC-like enzyme
MCECKRPRCACDWLPVLSLLARGGFLSAGDWAVARGVSSAWRARADAVVWATTSAVFTSDACAAHRVPGRSERPERLRAVLERCAARFPLLRVERALPPATDAQLLRFHGQVHVDMLVRMGDKIERSMVALERIRLERAASRGDAGGSQGDGPPRPMSPHRRFGGTTMSKEQYYAQFEFVDVDEDTRVMRHTLTAARVAAGGVCLAVDAVMKAPPDAGGLRNAFCVVRPPGHHAEPRRAMGFCFFNNVGVGALHALEEHGLSRVAIIDFDAHHGNGTQRRVELEPRLLYVSLHQAPYFPGTGASHETGEHGNILNVPLPARTGSKAYRRAFVANVWPRVAQFRPELLLVSAGFDAHEKDPLTDLRLTASDFYWVTNEITSMAWTFCHGRVVSVLEGGYNTRALADSAEQHVLALVHGSVPPPAMELAAAHCLDGSAILTTP